MYKTYILKIIHVDAVTQDPVQKSPNRPPISFIILHACTFQQGHLYNLIAHSVPILWCIRVGILFHIVVTSYTILVSM